MFKQLPVIEPEEAVKKLREDLDNSIKKGTNCYVGYLKVENTESVLVDVRQTTVMCD
jgi:hypothetical protein